MITQIPKKIYLFLNNRNLLDHAVDDVFPIIQLVSGCSVTLRLTPPLNSLYKGALFMYN